MTSNFKQWSRTYFCFQSLRLIPENLNIFKHVSKHCLELLYLFLIGFALKTQYRSRHHVFAQFQSTQQKTRLTGRIIRNCNKKLRQNNPQSKDTRFSHVEIPLNRRIDWQLLGSAQPIAERAKRVESNSAADYICCDLSLYCLYLIVIATFPRLRCCVTRARVNISNASRRHASRGCKQIFLLLSALLIFSFVLVFVSVEQLLLGAQQA